MRMRSKIRYVALGSLGLGLMFGMVLGVLTGPVSAEDEAPGRKALVRQGAREWSAYCGSCHNARPPSERSPAEWDTIMLHMRVRANLPARDAQALLEFLKSR